MKKLRNHHFSDNYGIANICIVSMCVICLIANSLFVSETALNQIASNKFLAYILNFLVGCEGKLVQRP